MNDLSDQEKSVLLAKARGEYAYETVSSRGDISHFMVYGGRIIPIADYYKPANMALAWRCHLWMLHREIERETGARDGPYTKWCKGMFPWWSDAVQELFLDKILSLLSR